MNALHIVVNPLLAISILGIMSVNVLRAEPTPRLTGSEAMALGLAVKTFKKIYAKPDLQHYKVELKRLGENLEVTFIANTPHTNAPGVAGTGGGSVYGPDMTYIVDVNRLKIVSFNFYR